MGIVNRYAKGLLTVLDSQTQGDTPSSMGDVIAPTMDLSQYLLASKGSVADQRSNIFIAAGQVVEAPVPVGEQWWLRSVHCEVIARDAVASNWRFAILVATPAIQFPVANTSGSTVALSILAHSFAFYQFFDTPLVLKTGDAIATACQSVSGVPILGVTALTTWVYDKLSA